MESPVLRPLGEDSLQMWGLNRRLEAYLARVKSLEEENGLLRAEVERLQAAPAEPSWRGRCEAEVAALRAHLDAALQDKHRAELARDGLREEAQQVRAGCQRARAAQEEARGLLSAGRRALEEEQRAQGWLRDRAAQLETELAALLAAHEEERAGLDRERAAARAWSLESGRAAPAAALQAPEVADYAQRLAGIWRGAVETYAAEVARLERALEQARAELGQVAEGGRQSQLRLQQLKTELAGLKGRKERLEESLARQWQLRHGDAEKLQLAVEALEEERRALRAQIVQVLEERQQLLQLKTSLSLEVATYRTLLEAESTRLQLPARDYKPVTGLRDAKLEAGQSLLRAALLDRPRDPRPSPLPRPRPAKSQQDSPLLSLASVLPQSRSPTTRALQKSEPALQAPPLNGFQEASPEQESLPFMASPLPSFHASSLTLGRGSPAEEEEEEEEPSPQPGPGPQEDEVPSPGGGQEEEEEPSEEPPISSLPYSTQQVAETLGAALQEVNGEDPQLGSSPLHAPQALNGTPLFREEDTRAAPPASPGPEEEAILQLLKAPLGAGPTAERLEDIREAVAVNGDQEAPPEDQREGGTEVWAPWGSELALPLDAGPLQEGGGEESWGGPDEQPDVADLEESDGGVEDLEVVSTEALHLSEDEERRELWSPSREDEASDLRAEALARGGLAAEQLCPIGGPALSVHSQPEPPFLGVEQKVLLCKTDSASPEEVVGPEEEEEALLKDLSAEEAVLRDVSMEKTLLREASTGEALVREANAEEALLNDVGVQEAILREVSAEEAMLRDTCLEKTLLRDASTGEVILRDSSPEAAIVRDLSAEETLLKDMSAEEAVLRETRLEKTLLRDVSMEEALLREANVEEALLRDTSAEEALLNDVGVQETLLKDMSAEEAMLRETCLAKTLLSDASSGEAILRDSTVEEAPLRVGAPAGPEGSAALAAEPRTPGRAETAEGLGEDVWGLRDGHKDESVLGGEDTAGKEGVSGEEAVGSDSVSPPEAVPGLEASEGGPGGDTGEGPAGQWHLAQQVEEEGGPGAHRDVLDEVWVADTGATGAGSGEEAGGSLAWGGAEGWQEQESPPRPAHPEPELGTDAGQAEEPPGTADWGGNAAPEAAPEGPAAAADQPQDETHPWPQPPSEASSVDSLQLQSKDSEDSPSASCDPERTVQDPAGGRRIVLEDTLPDHTPLSMYQEQEAAAEAGEQQSPSGSQGAAALPLSAEDGSAALEDWQQAVPQDDLCGPQAEESGQERAVKAADVPGASGEAPALSQASPSAEDFGEDTAEPGRDREALQATEPKMEETLARLEAEYSQGPGELPETGNDVEQEPEVREQPPEEAGSMEDRVFQAGETDLVLEGLWDEEDAPLEFWDAGSREAEGPAKVSPLTSVADLGEIVLDGEMPLEVQNGGTEAQEAADCLEEEEGALPARESQPTSDQESCGGGEAVPGAAGLSEDGMRDSDILEIVQQALEFNQEVIKAAGQGLDLEPEGDGHRCPEDEEAPPPSAMAPTVEESPGFPEPSQASSPRAKEPPAPTPSWAESSANGLPLDTPSADLPAELLNGLVGGSPDTQEEPVQKVPLAPQCLEEEEADPPAPCSDVSHEQPLRGKGADREALPPAPPFGDAILGLESVQPLKFRPEDGAELWLAEDN